MDSEYEITFNHATLDTKYPSCLGDLSLCTVPDFATHPLGLTYIILTTSSDVPMFLSPTIPFQMTFTFYGMSAQLECFDVHLNVISFTTSSPAMFHESCASPRWSTFSGIFTIQWRLESPGLSGLFWLVYSFCRKWNCRNGILRESENICGLF